MYGARPGRYWFNISTDVFSLKEILLIFLSNGLINSSFQSTKRAFPKLAAYVYAFPFSANSNK